MTKSRILVVDDEAVIRQLLSRTLSKKGYEIEVAEDGSKALEKTRDNFFNLLITDLKMPKASGMDVLKEIKKSNPYIEVIIITGYPTIDSAVTAIKVGAFDFICKPFDVKEITATVRRCLDKQKFSISHVELSELMMLFELNKTITRGTDLNSLLGLMLDATLGVVKAKKGSLMLLDEKTEELTIKVARGLSEEVINNTRVKIGEGICGKVAQEKKILLVDDIEQDQMFHVKNKPQYETKSFVSIPLLSKYSSENVLGVINIADKVSGDHFTDREQTLLSVVASQAVSVIENYKLYIQLQDKIEALQQIIKELSETQNQLIQTEKLASVGQLAFGIAHEIRNPLGIILGGVEFIKGYLAEKNGVIEESIEKIKNSIDRANNIILDLLKFSKASELNLQPLNVCRIMDEAMSLVKNQAYLSNVRINRSYDRKAIFVQGDPTMLRQAFLIFLLMLLMLCHKGESLGCVYIQKKMQIILS